MMLLRIGRPACQRAKQDIGWMLKKNGFHAEPLRFHKGLSARSLSCTIMSTYEPLHVRTAENSKMLTELDPLKLLSVKNKHLDPISLLNSHQSLSTAVGACAADREATLSRGARPVDRGVEMPRSHHCAPNKRARATS